MQKSIRVDVNNGLLLLLGLMPYTAFYGTPVLPTWRVVNLLFVILGLAFLNFNNKKVSLPSTLIFWQLGFLTCCVLQIAYLTNESRFDSYLPIFLVALLFLFAMCDLYLILLQQATNRVFKTLFYSVIFLFTYQVFQEIVFLAGKYDLAVILNESGIQYTAVFYRFIGPFLGSPGFMAESGHVALFVGPMAMNVIIVRHYGLAKIKKLFAPVCISSLVICLSGGAVVHFFFLLLLMLILNKDRLSTQGIGYAISIVLLFGITLAIVPAYFEVIFFRVQGFFTGDSERIRGAEAFISVWQKYPWFGLAPKASRLISGDPNTFIPVMLADHGLIGLSVLLGLWFVPLVVFFKKSSHPLFLIPYLSLTLHLFLAYGTYTWPIIWLNLMTSIWGLTSRKITQPLV